MHPPTDANKIREIETAAASQGEKRAQRKPFGPEWGSSYWGKWQTVIYILHALNIAPDAEVLDVGAGGGWTTIFLAEAGYQPLGVDIAPASVEIGRQRAQRVDVSARFEVADMDELALDEQFDVVIFFDALHHTARQFEVITRAVAHLRPKGWVVFGEPSWLHAISPHARGTHREVGWIERGIWVRRLKSDCRACGLTQFRRFHEGTAPHESLRAMLYQALRLIGSHTVGAPQMSVWLAAQR